MTKKRKLYSADLKAKAALEAIRGQKTISEIAVEYGVHPSQITQWKKQVLDGLPYLFSTRASDQAKIEQTFIASLHQEALIASLYQHIGILKVQVDGLEKKQNHAIEAQQGLNESEPPAISIDELYKLLDQTHFFEDENNHDSD